METHSALGDRWFVVLVFALTLLRYPLWPFPRPDGRFKLAVTVNVYDIDAHADYTSEEVAKATVVPMDAARFRSLVAKAEHKYRNPIWKGSSLAVVTLEDGREQHLAISYYSGFFGVVGEPGHWVLPESERAKLDEALGAIIQEQFIPARIGSDP